MIRATYGARKRALGRGATVKPFPELAGALAPGVMGARLGVKIRQHAGRLGGPPSSRARGRARLTQGEDMISNRSILRRLSVAAAIAMVASSCQLFHGSHDQGSPAVKASGDPAHSKAESRRTHSSPTEPEYVEGDVAPAIPAALPEERSKSPSPAHVWIAGQHTRRKGQWVWVPGHYEVPPSPEQVWVPGHWVSHLHGFAWIPGAWR
jgi:hypothetical protein